ncbi:MAG: hypothetical protein ABFE07_26340, partial [Armatimonadia bacterium]
MGNLLVLVLVGVSEDPLEQSYRWYRELFAGLGTVSVVSVSGREHELKETAGFNAAANCIKVLVRRSGYRKHVVWLRRAPLGDVTTSLPAFMLAAPPIEGYVTKFLTWYYFAALSSESGENTMRASDTAVCEDWTRNGATYLGSERALDAVLQPPASVLVRAWAGSGVPVAYPKVALVFASPDSPAQVADHFRQVLPRVGRVESLTTSGAGARLVLHQAYPYSASVLVSPVSPR